MVPFATAFAEPPAPLPGICDAGLHPAEDGRCTGVVPPEGTLGPADGVDIRSLGTDRALAILKTWDFESRPPRFRARAVVVDGSLEVTAFAPPFADVEAWLLATDDGGIVAIELHTPTERGGPVQVGPRVAWLDPDARGWVPGAPLPDGVVDASVVADKGGGGLWLVGTADGRGVWHGDRNGWTKRTPLPVARRGAELVAGTPGPTVCGGSVSGAPRSSSNPYDDATDDLVPGCVRWSGKKWTPAGWVAGVEQMALYALPTGVWGWQDGPVPKVVRVDGPQPGVPGPTVPSFHGPRAIGADLVYTSADRTHLVRYDPATGETLQVPVPGFGWAVEVGDTLAWVALEPDRSGAGASDRAMNPRIARLGPDGPDLGPDVEPPGTGSVVIATSTEVVAIDDARFTRWDPFRQQLVAGPSLPEPRYRPALAATTDGTLVVAGGTNGEGVPQLGTWRLRPGAAAWTPGPPLTEGLVEADAVGLTDGSVLILPDQGDHGVRLSAGAAVVVPSRPGRLVRLADGTAAVLGPTDLAKFDLATNDWVVTSHPSQPRVGGAVLATRDGGLVRAGGSAPSALDSLGTSTVERMDPDGTWRILAQLPHRAGGGWLAELDDGGWLFAGSSGDVSLYDPKSDRWSRAAPLGRGAGPSAPLIQVGPDTFVHLGGTLDSFVEVYRVTGATTEWPRVPVP